MIMTMTAPRLSHQSLVQSAKWLQRKKLKCEKLTTDSQWTIDVTQWRKLTWSMAS
jgi:hypothetical protein